MMFLKERVSSENIHSDNVVGRYTINSFQQTVNYIEVIQEVVLPKVTI